MTEKQVVYLEKIQQELQGAIILAERRNKIERKETLIKLQKLVKDTSFETSTFSVLVKIFQDGFSNTSEWQNYIWQNTTLQQNQDFGWIKELAKKEGV
jgi:hypothetical protein